MSEHDKDTSEVRFHPEARKFLAKAYAAKPGYEGNGCAIETMDERYPDSVYIGPLDALTEALRQRDDLLAANNALLERARRAEGALDDLLATFKSHVDGRDLLDELHPRKTLDIKRRVDGVETWFEGDWLSNVRDAAIRARAFRESGQ